jgi:hypothetical protein
MEALVFSIFATSAAARKAWAVPKEMKIIKFNM